MKTRVGALLGAKEHAGVLAGGIVQSHHQIPDLLGHPLMGARVLVHHHPRQGLALALLAVLAARLGAHHQLRLLQHVLHPAVAAGARMIATVAGVEVLDVPPRVVQAIQPLQPQHFIHRGAPAGHLRHAQVHQALHPIGLKAPNLAPKGALAYPPTTAPRLAALNASPANLHRLLGISLSASPVTNAPGSWVFAYLTQKPDTLRATEPDN